MKLLNEISADGKNSFNIPDFEEEILIPNIDQRQTLPLPDLSEIEVIRHYTNLSKLNFGVDNGFYPLGSCTMKYNPKINEAVANLPLFNIHPFSNNNDGALQIVYELEKYLCEITGMDAITLQPAAGAHGELTGIMIMKKYFEDIGEIRTKMLIPDSAHGTNPASVSLCGFESIQIKSSLNGGIDLEDLKNKMADDVVGLMLTNPNTLGLFDENILEITKIVHDKGGLCYMDGANMNAMLGIVKPRDFGFDVMHLNLHKTFSTPHGGGGPGSGPVGVVNKLEKFLPNPRVKKINDKYEFENQKDSIGKVHSFYGNFSVYLRAYTYIRSLGPFGLKRVGEQAVLNANYMKEILKQDFNLKFDRVCAHEFVIDDSKMPNHITTNDIAKRLLDYGFHPPTIYFPLIIPGAIMIEPTETENLDTLNEFISAMKKIKQEALDKPETLKSSPHSTYTTRLDSVAAARKPILNWNSDVS